MIKSKLILKFYIIWVLSILVISCDKPETKEDKVDTLLASWVSTDEPGIAVSIVKDGFPIYQKGFGLANLEYDIPITKSSVFHIASVSKQFTVFSILLLEKEGKLSLDDDIKKYIPEVQDFDKTITIRHLASHTSGIRDVFDLFTLSGWLMDDVMTNKQILNIIYKQNTLNSIPGSEFSYSNTGFVLLAEIVSRVSGMSFSEYTDKNIFKPLGMNNSLFYDNHEGVVKNRAYSYHHGYYYRTGFRKSKLNFSYVGSTGLFTTIEDFSLWAKNFKTLKVGDQNIIDTMNKPAVLNNGETTDYALGQFTSKYKGLNSISHSGGDAGYRSFFIRFPDQDLSITVFSNLASTRPWDIAYNIAYIYLKNDFISEDTSKDETIKVDVTSEVLDSYVGEYEVEVGSILNITKQNSSLLVKMKYPFEYIFNPQKQNVFINNELNMKIEFIDDYTVNKNLNFTKNGTTKLCKRLKNYDKSTINKSEYIGNYYSDELETKYEVILEDNKLLLKHFKTDDREMVLHYEDTFLLKPYSYFSLQMKKNKKNSITGFTISTPRSKNIWFKKIE